MGIMQAFKMAFKSIISNKVRSFLTMLGVIIGVGSVIAAVAFAQGTTKNITDTIKGMGTNLITITITGRNSNRTVAYEDLQAFADKNPDEIALIAPTVNGNMTVKNGTKSKDTTILGTSSDYEFIKNLHVQSGRFILGIDNDFMQKVAVIGTAVASELYVGQDPVGQNIKINGQLFTVVGVLEQKNNGQTGTADDQVIIPVTVAQRLSRNAVIRSFSVQAATPEMVNAAIDKLNDYLLGIFTTNTNNSAFRVSNQADLLDNLNTTTDTLMILLGGIAFISLVVGGIGIMNIMLVSVTERTREIGIRKAIGAKRRNILIQFLIEAAAVTGIGGVIGILLGVSLIRFVVGNIDKIAHINKIPTVYSPFWMLLSFGISLGVGIIFGMFPAYKAARLNPIEALRFE